MVALYAAGIRQHDSVTGSVNVPVPQHKVFTVEVCITGHPEPTPKCLRGMVKGKCPCKTTYSEII